MGGPALKGRPDRYVERGLGDDGSEGTPAIGNKTDFRSDPGIIERLCASVAPFLSPGKEKLHIAVKSLVPKQLKERYLGKSGKVLEVLLEKGRVRVEKLMTVKRHLKKGRSQANAEGGIIEKAGTIAISNVMVVGKGGEPGRREKIERELGAKEKARLEKRKTAAK